MDKTLARIKSDFNTNGNVVDALRRLNAYVEEFHIGGFGDRLERIQSNHSLLLDYMERGYKDPNRGSLYERSQWETYLLLQDLRLAVLKKANSTYRTAETRVRNIAGDFTEIRRRLEDFVTTLAMMGLESEEASDAKQKSLFEAHEQYLSQLFDYILVSPQWSEGEYGFFLDLLSSPSIDVNDAQTLVSAVTLSCVNILDIRKQQLLGELFLTAWDENIRQRALVGWALSLNDRETIAIGKQQQLAHRIMADEGNRRQVIELQKQLLYCINAEAVNRTIQEDIMPTLMKNNNFNINKFGIVETEDDPLRDVLHPEADEKAMEEVEKTIARMREMEKSGADIYFGGFRHMKRYAFFYTLSNWFVPFYFEHPGLSALSAQSEENKAITANVLKNVPFCNSDKYSFALAFSQVLEKLPPALKEMMQNGQIDSITLQHGDLENPAYIRRMYLQDLYRFYFLYASKNDFVNPIMSANGNTPNIFVADKSIFEATKVQNYYLEVLTLLGQFDSKDTDIYQNAIQNVLDVLDEGVSNELKIYKAYYHMRHNAHLEAINEFKALVSNGVEDEKVLKGLARCYMMNANYEEAQKLYQQLVDSHPDNNNYRLNKCVCLIACGNAALAMPTLYELNYKHPQNGNITRVLAWGLMNVGQYEKANSIYERLCEAEEPLLEDFLNKAYSLWLMNSTQLAVTSFIDFVKRQTTNRNLWPNILWNSFNGDRKFLNKCGLDNVDMRLMVELVCRK